MRRILSLFIVVVVVGVQAVVWTQPGGTLQIHFMDVGQGDGAVLIAPDGETVLFDNGVWQQCDKPMVYLQQLGITKIDYQILSHYHQDHLGCTAQVLGRFPLQQMALDRGGSYHGDAYTAYVTAVGPKRHTATDGQIITLNQGGSAPVVIRIVALNGNGVPTDNENDESVVSLVSFGNFRAEIGGDLSGFAENSYADIETSVAPKVDQVDVYKVHHHGSRYSSNPAWLQAITPRIAIVSTGDGNTYNHPTQECLERLHNAGIKTYWTETGNGVPPETGVDTVAGTIIVEVPANSNTYTVRHTLGSQSPEQFQTWMTSSPTPTTPTPTGPTPSALSYAWSTHSNIYHVSTCRFVTSISSANLRTGTTPPAGKSLHKDCPR